MTPITNLTCHDLIDLAGASYDRELTPVQTDAVDAHLAGCSKCREYLKSYGAVVKLARTAMLESGEKSNSLAEDLIKDILSKAFQGKKGTDNG